MLDKSPTADRPPFEVPPASRPAIASRGMVAAVALTCIVASAALGWFAFGGGGARDSETNASSGQTPSGAPPGSAPVPAASQSTSAAAAEVPTVTPRPAGSPGRATTVKPEPASIPRSDPPSSQPSPPVPSPVTVPTSARGLTGCWTYNNAVHLNMDDAGRVTGFLGGRWAAAGGDEFVITWPPTTDTVVLSADGRSLSGSNNYGGPGVSGRRASGSTRGLPGSWNWGKGQTAVFQDDGRAIIGPIAGTWTELRDRTYRVVWDYVFVDRLTLSADGRTMAGRNQLGQPLTGARVPCA